MGTTVLAFFVFVVLFTLMGYVSMRWANRYMQRFIEGRLEAIETIVNHRRVPERWLARHRKRAARLAGGGASEGVIRRLSGIARKRCLANIRELIRFVEARGLADADSTKRIMLAGLREEAARWEDEASWADLVDLLAPPPEPLYETEASEDEV